MVEQWGPDIKVPILPGTPAIQWGKRSVVAAALVPLMFLILVIGMLAIDDGYGESGLLAALMGLILIDVLLLCYFGSMSAWRERAERKHGYTTVLDKTGLREVDIESGYVIRLATEDPLKPDERDKRRAAIKAARSSSCDSNG